MRIYRLARRKPDKVAVIDTDFSEYTYRQLDSMADAISKLFPSEAPSRVGILSGAGVDQIASILAVVKNGGAYVPLNPALNGASLRKMAADARVDFVITDKANAPRMEGLATVVLPAHIAPADTDGYLPTNLGNRAVACAMPGVGGRFDEYSRVEVRRHAQSVSEELGITDKDVVLQSAVASSPMFFAEVFATLMKGATLAILPEKNRAYAKAVADYAERAGVTVICASRPMAQELGLLGRLPSKLRMLLSAASDKLSSRFRYKFLRVSI